MNDILTQLKERIREEALKPEVFQEINGMIEHSRELERKLEAELKRLALSQAEEERLSGELRQMKTRAVAAENKAEELEGAVMKAAVAEAKASTVRECFGLVFRNAEVRRSILEDVPLPMTTGTGDYTSTHVERHNTNKTVTEEQV